MVRVVPALWRAHLGRWSGNSCYFADVSKIGQDTAGRSALSLCSRCVACKYGSISRFKGVFSEVWGCCVGLCCLGALRGLWGFCVREWLGGFRACGVFAFHLSVFPLLCLPFHLFTCFLSFCPALLWLSFVALCGCVVGVAFSLSDKTKKERICFALFLYLVLVSLF